MSENKSSAEFYGMKEIPFEPTGSATVYPYVPPDDFKVIEEVIKETANERKMIVLLLRAPQGGGKTATVNAISARISSDDLIKGQKISLSNKLLDLEIHSYVTDFIESAAKYVKDKRLLAKVPRDAPIHELRNIMVKLLTHFGSNNKVTLWIIDEFDILGDHPPLKQSQFLQFLRDVVEELANRHLPILFIMSHTQKSSKEFAKHIDTMHGPFKSRISNMLDIGYRYEEVKNIVIARLNHVGKTKRSTESIAPFSEAALRNLYDLVTTVSDSNELTNFRLFEICCYNAMLNGAKKKQVVIDEQLVRETFEKVYQKEIPRRDQSKLSLQTRSQVNDLSKKGAMIRNEALLKGLQSGFVLLKDDFVLKNPATSHIATLPGGIELNSLSFTADYRGKIVNTLWFVASKDSGAIMPSDTESISVQISSAIQNHRTNVHLRILSYVSNVELRRSSIPSCDQLIIIRPEVVEPLIALGLSQDDEKPILRKAFDAEISPIIKDIYARTIADITTAVSNTTLRLCRILFLSSFSGKSVTKESLRDDMRAVELTKNTPDKYFVEAKESGFFIEKGNVLVPNVPGSLEKLFVILSSGSKDSNEVQQIFGETTKFVIECAKALGVIEKKDFSIARKTADDVYSQLRIFIDEFRKASQYKKVENTNLAGLSTLLISSLENVSRESNEIAKLIVYSAALEYFPNFIESVKKLTTSGTENIMAGSGSNQTGASTGSYTAGSPSDQAAASTTTTRRPPQGGELEKLILSCLENERLTLSQLIDKVKQEGASGDIRSTILSLIMKDRLKVGL